MLNSPTKDYFKNEHQQQPILCTINYLWDISNILVYFKKKEIQYCFITMFRLNIFYVMIRHTTQPKHYIKRKYEHLVNIFKNTKVGFIIFFTNVISRYCQLLYSSVYSNMYLPFSASTPSLQSMVLPLFGTCHILRS